MYWQKILVCCVFLGAVFCERKFPPGFKFGAAMAAYQVEGAWNASDKSPSIWDVFTHNKPEAIIDGSNGDVACDSYNLWRRDVEIAAELGLHFYRFSIAWSRLLPSGFSNYISEDGKKYYNDLIDALIEKGIQPIVTLYHWDLPQSLQDLGGWTNPLVAEWFGEYARVAYSLYADRVKAWVTINEPIIFCQASYNLGIHAPGILRPGVGNYLCSKHALLAHAKAWRIYDQEFRLKYQGKVAPTNQLMWFEPDTEEDQEYADLTQQLWTEIYTHPVYSKEGGWPPSLEKKIAEKSRQEGYAVSRLPPFTEEEKELVRGTYDFFGFNFYTARTVRKARPGEEVGPWPYTGAPDLGAVMSVRPDWQPGATGWFFVYHEAIRLQLSWVRQQYGDVDVFILENGVPGYDTDLNDQHRVDFYRKQLEQVLLSMTEDGVRISGYTAWTMIDNFEWSDGYRSKFGLYEVDFQDPMRTRRPRASAHFYKNVIRTHSVDVDSSDAGIKITDELTLILSLVWDACRCTDLKFPPGFQFGAATSAYQVEGAWNVSDKGLNIWDVALHASPRVIIDGNNGDVACDSYHQWKTDVRLAHELGLHFYRFSISWVRILPTGFPNKVSKDGVKYYNKLIDGLLNRGIEPVITLYHFDLPQSIQNLGGWANPHAADWFSDYARIVFTLYADRVKTWITINEPQMVCDHVYTAGELVPLVQETELGPFLCNKHLMLAHAKAWRIYDEEFKPKYHGKMSIGNNPIWVEPLSKKDEELTEIAREFGAGRYSDPIYSAQGGWPRSVEKLLADYSKKQGYPYSRLPSFTEEEKKLIQGTYDFYSLNHYTTRLVRSAHKNETPGLWFMKGSKELNLVLETDPEWTSSDFKFIVVYPKGIRNQIKWLQQRYNNVSILITENGFGTNNPTLYDTGRIAVIRDYLKQILLAINEDGANVVGYTVWSLMDNFEWMFGFSMKFGLFSVDFSDPLRRRTARASALYYRSIIKHHSLDVADYSHHYQHLKGVDAPHNDAAKKFILYRCTSLFIVSLVYTVFYRYIL